jgi:hypothetical protein
MPPVPGENIDQHGRHQSSDEAEDRHTHRRGPLFRPLPKTVLQIPVFWALMQEPEPESSRLCFCFESDGSSHDNARQPQLKQQNVILRIRMDAEKRTEQYIILIALILLVSYFSMTSGSFSAKPGELLSTLFTTLIPSFSFNQIKKERNTDDRSDNFNRRLKRIIDDRCSFLSLFD